MLRKTRTPTLGQSNIVDYRAVYFTARNTISYQGPIILEYKGMFKFEAYLQLWRLPNR